MRDHGAHERYWIMSVVLPTVHPARIEAGGVACVQRFWFVTVDLDGELASHDVDDLGAGVTSGLAAPRSPRFGRSDFDYFYVRCISGKPTDGRVGHFGEVQDTGITC